MSLTLPAVVWSTTFEFTFTCQVCCVHDKQKGCWERLNLHSWRPRHKTGALLLSVLAMRRRGVSVVVARQEIEVVVRGSCLRWRREMGSRKSYGVTKSEVEWSAMVGLVMLMGESLFIRAASRKPLNRMNFSEGRSAGKSIGPMLMERTLRMCMNSSRGKIVTPAYLTFVIKVVFRYFCVFVRCLGHEQSANIGVLVCI